MNIFRTVSLEKTPMLLKWASTLRGFMFILPVVILFFKFKGLTVGDFFLIQGIFAIAVFILEIPTGYIGDLFSRKKIIILSSLVYLLGYVVWLFFSGFYFILLGKILFALSLSLSSGTFEAYLYDVLKKQGKEKDITKELGKTQAYTTYGTAFATFAGGFVYNYLGPNATILTEIIFLSLSFILTLYIPDIPDVKRVVEEGKSKLRDILEISHYASTHSEIKWLMLFPATFGAGTLILMWFQQPLMENNMVPVILFGIFIGFNQLFRGLFAHHSSFLIKKLKTKNYSLSLFAILIMGLTVAYLLPNVTSLYITYVLLILVAFATASQASLRIVGVSMINHRVKSDERATVLSVSSMFSSLFCSSTMITIKFLIDSSGIQQTIAIVAPIIILLTFISMAKLLKLKI